jgi:hypothetical protein
VSGSRQINLLQSAFGTLLVVCFICGCGKSSEENAISAHSSEQALSQLGEDMEAVSVTSVAGTSGVLLEAKQNKKEKAKEIEDEEEEEKDYWKDVQFDREHFEEVQNFVRVNYIDPATSEDRAFGEACNFALLGLNKPVMLLPTKFYKKRKGHEDEEGALDGKARKFGKRTELTMVTFKEDDEEEEEPRKRLTDDEIREARDKFKKRQALLEETWSGISFGRDDMDYCLAEGKKLGMKDKDQKKEDLERDLWLWAAQGLLRSLDPHSAIVSA